MKIIIQNPDLREIISIQLSDSELNDFSSINEVAITLEDSGVRELRDNLNNILGE